MSIQSMAGACLSDGLTYRAEYKGLGYGFDVFELSEENACWLYFCRVYCDDNDAEIVDLIEGRLKGPWE